MSWLTTRVVVAIALAAAGAAGHAEVTIDPEITFGTISAGNVTIKLYDIPADCEIRGEGMSAAKVWGPGQFEMGCWEARDGLIYLRFRDGTKRVAPRSAIKLGPKYRKPLFSL